MKTFEKNGLDVSKISPACGEKYSPNLYQWLISPRNKGRVWALRVYRDTANTLWIGMLDGRELIGAKLIAILCNGASEQSSAWQNIDAVEVPDFWDRYTADGRCAIDVTHTMWFIDEKARWNVSGQTRSCQWCGNASQKLKRWTEKIQREEWTNLEVL